MDKNSAIIKDFTYDDEGEWPTEPDGNGPALVLIRPETNPDHNNPANWRTSSANRGNPGYPDSQRFATFIAAHGLANQTGDGDADQDGLPDLLEYALGTNPIEHNRDGFVTGSATVASLPYLTVTVSRPMGLDDATFMVECSTTLTGTWTPATLESRTANYATGMIKEVWRNPATSQGAACQFMRPKAVTVP